MKPLFGFLDERRESYLLGLSRVAFAMMSAHQASKLLRSALEHGYFADRFYISFLPEAWVPSRPVYLALLSAQIAAALVAALGKLARPLLLFASCVGLYLLCCNRLDYHNNRYILHLMVLLLAFAPCDRSFLAFGPKRSAEQRIGPVWAQRLAQAQISLVYLASAGSKLFDEDWRGGQVLWLRYRNILRWCLEHGHSLPDSVVAVLGSPTFAELTSKAAISTELFVALGLWFGRTRAFALWLGALLHFGIELAASVEIFSFLMWASYLLFCVPELRERKFFYDESRANSRTFGRALQYLDWLARFEITPQVVPSAESKAARWGISAIDRNQRKEEGLGALVLVARAVPLLFPLWLPLFVLQQVTRPRRPAE